MGTRTERSDDACGPPRASSVARAALNTDIGQGALCGCYRSAVPPPSSLESRHHVTVLDDPTLRRGDCPGVQRPFLEADGLLVRVRIPGGIVTTHQAAVLAGVAAEHGSGVIELTSRANVQIRGVAPERHRLLVEELVAAGLAHADPDVDQRRNVVASPTTGLDDGLIDIRPIVEQIVDELMATDRSIDPKAGVLIDDGGRFSLRDRRHTVVLRAARRRSGEVVFRRADSDDVVDPIGAARVAVDLIHGRAPVGLEQVRPDTFVAPAAAAGRPLGVFGRFVGVAPVLGRLDAETLARLADLAHDEVRFTPWRGIVLPGPEPVDIETLFRLGLIVSDDDPAAGVVACSGSRGCTEGRADTIGTALDLVDRLRRDRTRITVHVSGCEKRCASRADHDLTLIANTSGSFDAWPEDRATGSTTGADG